MFILLKEVSQGVVTTIIITLKKEITLTIPRWVNINPLLNYLKAEDSLRDNHSLLRKGKMNLSLKDQALLLIWI